MEEQEFLYGDDYPRMAPTICPVLALLRFLLTITQSTTTPLLCLPPLVGMEFTLRRKETVLSSLTTTVREHAHSPEWMAVALIQNQQQGSSFLQALSMFRFQVSID